MATITADTVVDELEQARRRQAAYLLDPDLREEMEGDGFTYYPKQQMATELAEQADELLFGGAAGPGKTEWGLRYCIREMERYAGNRGVIFRRVFPSLRRTIIPRLQEILAGGRAKFNKNESTFTFPNGSVLEVASLQYETDVHDYQGAEYGIIFFEEITEFLESQYEYLLTRLRVPSTFVTPRGPDGSIDWDRMIRPHAICTTNPGGVGHVWVKRRWISPYPEDLEVTDRNKTPGQRAYTVWKPKFDPKKHTKELPPLKRVYVPSVLTDNPALLERDPGYLGRLRAQSRRGLREALEYGDWDALEAIAGALWEASIIDSGRIDPEIYLKTVDVRRRVVAVDPSDGEEDGDEYGVCVASMSYEDQGYVEEAYGWKLSVSKMAEATVRLAKRVKADAIVVEKNHGGKWMLEVLRQANKTHIPVIVVWASVGKETRAQPVASLFEENEYRKNPVAAHIVGFKRKLEEELTTTSFTNNEPSPNLLDAMVWALTDLFDIGGPGELEILTGTTTGEKLAGRR